MSTRVFFSKRSLVPQNKLGPGPGPYVIPPLPPLGSPPGRPGRKLVTNIKDSYRQLLSESGPGFFFKGIVVPLEQTRAGPGPVCDPHGTCMCEALQDGSGTGEIKTPQEGGVGQLWQGLGCQGVGEVPMGSEQALAGKWCENSDECRGVVRRIGSPYATRHTPVVEVIVVVVVVVVVVFVVVTLCIGRLG